LTLVQSISCSCDSLSRLYVVIYLLYRLQVSVSIAAIIKLLCVRLLTSPVMTLHYIALGHVGNGYNRLLACLPAGLSLDIAFQTEGHHIPSTSNLILKCFVSRDVSLYLDESIHGLCSPHIGICFVVWSPYQMGPIKQIKSVQRSFTRRLLYRTCIEYKTRLLRLGEWVYLVSI